MNSSNSGVMSIVRLRRCGSILIRGRHVSDKDPLGEVFLFGSRLVLKIATPVPTVDGGRLMVRSMVVTLVGTNIAKLNKQITGADIWAGPTRCPMLTTTFASSPLICCAAHNPIRRRQSFAHDIKKNWSGEIICFYARVRQLIPIQKHTLVVVEFAYVFRAEDGK